jgi:CheY-like chemotaxis protein
MTEEKQVLYLVDDDVDFLEITAGVLEAAGYRVERFTDPEDALRRMGEQRPDLLISDLMMDRYDAGFSFASKVKA